MDTTHTVGFVFSKDQAQVLLMLKNRPPWQKGKYNGPGGKVEAGETAIQCVAREVFEETNISIEEDAWIYFAEITEGSNHIEFFATISSGYMLSIEQKTDEPIKWVDVDELPENIIPNLRWLIPMALNRLDGERMNTAHITYTAPDEDNFSRD